MPAGAGTWRGKPKDVKAAEARTKLGVNNPNSALLKSKAGKKDLKTISDNKAKTTLREVRAASSKKFGTEARDSTTRERSRSKKLSSK